MRSFEKGEKTLLKLFDQCSFELFLLTYHLILKSSSAKCSRCL